MIQLPQDLLNRLRLRTPLSRPNPTAMLEAAIAFGIPVDLRQMKMSDESWSATLDRLDAEYQNWRGLDVEAIAA